MTWSVADMPDLTGKVALVTGGSAGIGYEVSLQLAKKGARVLIASRNAAKVEAAVAKLREAAPGASVAGYTLDLAAFSSIDAFVDKLRSDGVSALHILVANAGVFVPPFAKTEQGFEVQLGTNAVGTIYCTERLLPLLQAGAPSRVVILSSDMASSASELQLGDCGGEALTTTFFAQYMLSKLYDALYAVALSRRPSLAGSVSAFAVHPGFVKTEIQEKADLGVVGYLLKGLSFVMAVPEADGALSSLYAGTAPGLSSGQSFGPDKLNRGFTDPWQPNTPAFTAENADKMMEAATTLIKAKGGKL